MREIVEYTEKIFEDIKHVDESVMIIGLLVICRLFFNIKNGENFSEL